MTNEALSTVWKEIHVNTAQSVPSRGRWFRGVLHLFSLSSVEKTTCQKEFTFWLGIWLSGSVEGSGFHLQSLATPQPSTGF